MTDKNQSTKQLYVILFQIDAWKMASSNLQCMLQCDQPCSAVDSLDRITDVKWTLTKEKSLQWRGLEKFGNV